MTSPVLKVDAARARLEAVGQEHLLHFADVLSPIELDGLLAQIEQLELARIPALVEKYVKGRPNFAPTATLEPAVYYPRNPNDPRRAWDEVRFRIVGEHLIRTGRVAAFTVAGGQGTRLGYDGPKGEFPAGAVTNKPLFQCLADWILAAERKWGCSVPWYIMTSPLNHARTVEYFKEKMFFGLRESEVMFFQQGVMPSFDKETGKILLAEKGVIATNPDGHGGSLLALHRSGALRDMHDRGIEQISYVQVDNLLARVIDPVFLGLHAAAEDSSREMSSKMVAKTDPAEKVGIFCRAGGKTQVVEYSDLPEVLAQQRNPDGSLRFNAGSIVIHVLSVDFVRRLNSSTEFGLPFHRAEKKVPFVDLKTGILVQPEKANAVKLEAFVFDAVPLCGSSIVYETDRIEEFAPIKNADGNDSPETCARIQTERAARWLERAGVKVARNAKGEPDCTIELSPLTAMEGAELVGKRLPQRINSGEQLAL